MISSFASLVRWLTRLLALLAALSFACGAGAAARHAWAPPPGLEEKAPPGWAAVEANSCPVKRVKASSLERLPAVPTIITDVASAWPSFTDWQNKTKFMEEFGDLSLTYSPVEGPLSLLLRPPQRKTEKLRDFVAGMEQKQAFEIEPEYPETDAAVHAVRQAAGTWKLPRSTVKLSPQPTISVGGHGAGLPFHVHGASWLALMVGMKIWFIYPAVMPQEAYDTVGITPVSSWAARDYLRKLPKQHLAEGGLKGRPFRCLQQPGEIMWVPGYWWHATYNLGEAVGVGSQSKLFPEEARKAYRKYPDSSAVLHQLMLHYASKRPLADSDAKQALDYGQLATQNAPSNPKFAQDYAALLRSRGDGPGCRNVLRDCEVAIDKLLVEEMILGGEAEVAKRQLLGAASDCETAGPFRVHDEL